MRSGSWRDDFPWGAVLAVVLLAVLAGFGVTTLLNRAIDDKLIVLPISVVFSGIALLVMIQNWRTGQKDILNPLNVFVLIMFLNVVVGVVADVVDPLLFAAYGQWSITTRLFTALNTVMYSFAFFAGYLMIRRRRTNWIPCRTDSGSVSYDATRVKLVLAYSVMVSLWMVWDLSTRAGGLIELVTNLMRRREFLDDAGYATLLGMSGLGAFLLWFAVEGHKRRFWVAGSWTVVALAGFLVRGGRNIPMVVLLAIFLITNYASHKRPSLLKVVVVGALLLAFFAGYRALTREYLVATSGGRGPIYGQLQELSLVQRLNGGFTDFLPSFALVVDNVPLRIEYQLGRTLIGYVTLPIPRSIFPDKPPTSAGVYNILFNSDRLARGTGITPSILGEIYLNFGSVGLLVLGIGLGRLYRDLYDRYSPQLGPNRTTALWACVIATMYYVQKTGFLALVLIAGLSMGILIADRFCRARPRPSGLPEENGGT